MKEVRAYVREAVGGEVVTALIQIGCLDFSILEVRGIAAGVRGHHGISLQLGEGFERMLKFEVLCRDANAEAIADAIRRAAHTGQVGDGVVAIAPVDDAVHVRNAARGEGALRK